MPDQLVFIGHACEIPAQHFIRPQGGLAPRPQGNQHTGDNSRIGLQFDAVAVVAEQMPATQNMLKKAKEDLHRPAVLEN